MKLTVVGWEGDKDEEIEEEAEEGAEEPEEGMGMGWEGDVVATGKTGNKKEHKEQKNDNEDVEQNKIKWKDLDSHYCLHHMIYFLSQSQWSDRTKIRESNRKKGGKGADAQGSKKEGKGSESVSVYFCLVSSYWPWW